MFFPLKLISIAFCGFSQLHAFVKSWVEQYKIISKRGLSGLIEIVDKAFVGGLGRFRLFIEKKPKDQPVFEPVDFFIFRNTDVINLSF
jgi:hypothetical protein